MKASEANFLSIIKSPKQFIIPIYQRTYSWQIAQCNTLLEDIIRIGKDPDSSGHFIGSVVYFQERTQTTTEVPKLLVIDGQQRITTVLLLLAAVADFIKDKEGIIDTNYEKLQNYYLLNREEKTELKYKLILTKRDKETLINVINEVELQENDSRRIAENFQHFKRQISRENVTNIYSGIQRLFAVDVALERGKDDPQLIFESMNSTGLDLSQADLIRNYVLMRRDMREQTELYEKYWLPMEQSYGDQYASAFNKFMRDYLTVKSGEIPRMDKVYEEFKTYVRGDKAPKTIIDVVKDICKFSSYYVNMVLEKEPLLELQKGFKNISQLKVDVSYPFLLPVYDDYANHIITQEQFLEIVALIENYVFRRAICEIPTNSLNKTFATLYKSVKKENYLESLKAVFQKMDGYKSFPDDAEFEKELVNKNVFEFRSRNYLLSKLENYKRKEIVNVEGYTIEHILPQNPRLSEPWQKMLGENWKEVQKKYLHTIGNLTLTGYNSELSDKPFSDKKTMPGGFNDSPIRLNAFMRSADSWNAEQIQKRAADLAGKAKEIWPAPNLPSEVLDKYKTTDDEEATTEGKEVYTLENYRHLRGANLELYYALRKRILNIDSSVKEKYKRIHIAFKSTTTFVDIDPQKARLRLNLNVKLNQINDPKGLCRCKDVSNIERGGNEELRVGFSEMGQLDDVMELIQQAFDAQFEPS